jgi:hypothetical protein
MLPYADVCAAGAGDGSAIVYIVDSSVIVTLLSDAQSQETPNAPRLLAKLSGILRQYLYFVLIKQVNRAPLLSNGRRKRPRTQRGKLLPAWQSLQALCVDICKEAAPS